MAQTVLGAWDNAIREANQTYEGQALWEVLQGIDDAYGPAYEQAQLMDSKG